MKTLRYLVLTFAVVGVGMWTLGKYVQSRMTPQDMVAYEEAKQRAAEHDHRKLMKDAEAQRAMNALRAEFQTLIADVYRVETSRFIANDLLHVSFAPGSDVQGNCQAIANLWAHQSGLPWVRVESWQGSQRLAQATVRN